MVKYIGFRCLVPNTTHVKIKVIDGEVVSHSCMRDSGELLSGDIKPLSEQKGGRSGTRLPYFRLLP